MFCVHKSTDTAHQQHNVSLQALLYKLNVIIERKYQNWNPSKVHHNFNNSLTFAQAPQHRAFGFLNSIEPLFRCLTNLDHSSLLYLPSCLDTRNVVFISANKPTTHVLQFSMALVNQLDAPALLMLQAHNDVTGIYWENKGSTENRSL